MIDVKAARRSEKAPHDIAQLYARATQDAPLSARGPALLLAVLAAVIGYFQGLLDSGKAAATGGQEQPEETQQGGEPRKQIAEDAPTEAEAEAGEPEETGSIKEKAEKAIGSGGPGPSVPGLADFLSIDSPMFDFDQLPLPPLREVRIPDAFGDDASNDNWASGRLVAGSGGTGSGFAGGGFVLPVINGSGGNGAGDGGGGLDPIPDRETPGQGGRDPEPAPRNRAPRISAPVRLVDIGPCQTSILTVALLLAGAADADADPLSISNITVSHGTLKEVEGGWLYTPAKAYFGPVTVRYLIGDGTTAVVQSASFDVVEFIELMGTNGDDVLVGTECRDRIDALGGDDTIHGLGAADIVLAGDGDDVVHAGAGDDIVHGGAGGDTIHAGAGDDTVYGGGGDDVIHGDAGNDILYGEAGNDTIRGGDGSDMIDGADGNDTLSGGGGDDTILAGNGDDLIDGGDGNDTIDAGAGRNVILTGSGTNTVVAGNGGNSVVGGSGVDTVKLGGGSDVVRAGGGGDVVDAGGGDDAVFGEAGRDQLAGGAGNDHLDGGVDDDLLDGGDGDDLLVGGEGKDVMMAGEGADDVDAGDGDDFVTAGGGDDVVMAQAGDDVVLGEAGDDCLDGGAGDDTILAGDGADVVHGSTGNDMLAGGGGADRVKGGAGDDRIVVDADCANDSYDGGAGVDTLDLGSLRSDAMVDLVQGKLSNPETGEDSIACFEVVIGGAGDDSFIISANSPTAVAGGKGKDTFSYELDGRNAVEDAQELIHKILDLEAGDRILVSQYTLRRDDDECDGEDERDGFERIYGENGDDVRPFSFRIEKIGERETTFVDVEVEGEDGGGFTIEISGAHHLYYYS